jgi:hypothetical protein
MKKLLPFFLKSIIRFLYYKQQRAKVFREPGIRKKQNRLIKKYDPDTKKIIVFLVMGADWNSGIDKISGGTISIVSLCEESKKLKAIHNSEVIMCTFPKQHLLLYHTQFKNNTTVFRFKQLKKYFKNTNDVLIHVPEFLSQYFLENLTARDKAWLKKMKNVHINIMNQNIQLMPSPKFIDELKSIATLVTITTAHQQYCNQSYRDKYSVPLHKFSVWISPEKYYFKKYDDKENLVIVSPDDHPMREKVISKLNSINGLKVQIIQNLTYEQYKETISKAKWAITFGEGLDGYIIEPIFSGTIGFAVYNENFFTSDFENSNGIYHSYNEMSELLASDIKKLDNSSNYKQYQKEQFNLCAKHYNFQQYQNNIAAFYREEYTYG